MAVKRIAAETLIELAVATLKSEILPTVAPEHRYTAAMLVNALEIARRDIIADDEASTWSLLDSLYPDGDGTAAQLALDIRMGRISDTTHPDLRKRLHTMLVSELKVRNPRFLTGRDTPPAE